MVIIENLKMKMRKHKVYSFFSLFVVSILLMSVVSCRKEHEKLVTLCGVIDDAAGGDDSKVYLSDRERWLRWESDDKIFVWSPDDGKGAIYDLDGDSHKQLTGTFTNTEADITASSTLYAFYPTSIAEKINGIGDNNTIVWPSSYAYREIASSTEPITIPDPDPDLTFGKGAIPLVAYRPAGDGHDLFFHSLAGILRFQLYGGTGLTDEFTIQQIDIIDRDRRLSGDFTITRAALMDNQPYVTAVASPTPAEKTISITGINKTIGGTGVNKNNLFTFYLPLPAVAEPYGSGSHQTTYHLKMKVIGTQGGTLKYFVRTMTVDIRRLSLTMMQAMEINGVVPDETGSGSEGTATVVGCGTEERPFQVYTAQQLAYIKDRMNAGGTVNGQPLGSNTYIKIVRSDINLLPPDSKGHAAKTDPTGSSVVWTSGFSNFTGHIYFSSAAGENGGITNISDHPLFESIAANGNVDGVYVKGDKTFTSGSGTFSPMCGVNHGTMTDCHNRCNVTSKSGHNLAGLCCENHGIITGGANDALLKSTGGNVAGICYTNESGGRLQGNFSLSSSIPTGDNIAGICFENKSGGIVENCQVAANIPTISSSGNWGVVVFENSGEVNNCRSVGTIVFTTSGSIGGVVHTNNTDGTIDGCSLNVTLRGGHNYVGGIVAYMSGGELRNCSVDGDRFIYGIPSGGSSNQATYAGGIVGYLQGGKVYNCFNRCPVTGAVNCGSVLGRIDDGAIIENCWSDYSHDFLGEKSTSRPDQGEIGPFCFSSYASDASWNCVYINKSNGYTIQVPQQMTDMVNAAVAAAEAAEGSLDPTMARFKNLTDGTAGSTLLDALNYWKTNYGSSCWSWVISSAGYPVFNPTGVSKHHRSVTMRHAARKTAVKRKTTATRKPSLR